MIREENAITERQALPAILKKARVNRLAGFTLNTPLPALPAS